MGALGGQRDRQCLPAVVAGDAGRTVGQDGFNEILQLVLVGVGKPYQEVVNHVVVESIDDVADAHRAAANEFGP